MVRDIHARLQAGDRDGARKSLARFLRDFFKDHIVTGHADHPVLSPAGGATVSELRSVGGVMVEDVARGHYVEDVLAEVQSRITRKEGAGAVVFLFNHAMHLLLPDYPLLVLEAIEAATLELGGRISDANDEDAFLPFLPAQSTLLILAASAGFQGVDEARLDKVQGLTLNNLDASEGVIPGLPTIFGIENDDLVFGCPSCGARRRAPLGSAGDAYGCGCGAWTRVPIPGLARLGAHLDRKRKKAMGLGRCRVCNAVIQTGRDGFMRAGFCSALCASQAPRSFGEHVPREGVRDGNGLRFVCDCKAALHAPLDKVGTKVTCDGCGLQVWVPEAPRAAGRPTVTDCKKCGRKVKTTARRCVYCGASVSA